MLKKQCESKSRFWLCTAASVQLTQLEVDAPDQQCAQSMAELGLGPFGPHQQKKGQHAACPHQQEKGQHTL